MANIKMSQKSTRTKRVLKRPANATRKRRIKKA